MKHYVIRYGLYAGCALVVLGLFNWLVIAQSFGYDRSQLFGYGSMIASLLTIPLGIKYFKDKLNQGKSSFGQAFKIGMGISLIAGVVMFLYGMIFFMVAYDDFIAWYQNSVSTEEWATIQTQMEAMPDYVYSPFFQGILLLVTVFLIGLVITLVSSLTLKTSWRVLD